MLKQKEHEFCSYYSHSRFWFLQDEGLDIISEGLDTLKNLAHDMNEVGYESCFTSNSI